MNNYAHDIIGMNYLVKKNEKILISFQFFIVFESFGVFLDLTSQNFSEKSPISETIPWCFTQLNEKYF